MIFLHINPHKSQPQVKKLFLQSLISGNQTTSDRWKNEAPEEQELIYAKLLLIFQIQSSWTFNEGLGYYHNS